MKLNFLSKIRRNLTMPGILYLLSVQIVIQLILLKSIVSTALESETDVNR